MSGTRVARAETGEGLLDTRYGVPLLGISRDRDSLDGYRTIFLPGQSLPPQLDNTCGLVVSGMLPRGRGYPIMVVFLFQSVNKNLISQ